MYKPPICVIIGAYSSGAKIAPYLQSQGMQIAHVTLRNHWELARLRETYTNIGICQNHILNSKEEVLNLLLWLSQYFRINSIISGTETSVALSEDVAELFSVPQNPFVSFEESYDSFSTLAGDAQKYSIFGNSKIN